MLTCSQDRPSRVATWLSSFDYRLVHNDIIAKRVDETGTWLLRSDEFKEWLHAPHKRVLWCWGMRESYPRSLPSLFMPSKAGVGKTVLA